MNTQTKVAVILAGGLGKRLRALVSEVPKPMAPINNKPFLEILIDFWINQGIEQFIISVGYLKGSVKSYFGKSYKNKSITYVDEEAPLGTGGALKKVLNEIQNLKTPFLVLNGDTFFDINLNKFESFHLRKKSDFSFALFKTQNNPRYLQFKKNDEDKIISLEKNNSSNEIFSNGGAYLITDKNFILNYSSSKKSFSLESDLIMNNFSQKNLYGYYSDGFFLDIGLPSDYERAIKIFDVNTDKFK
ncbi:MAG: NTP transferase domain-containing protein [Methylophilaceae bacterium]|nr:NTP transferase domain-containing protein [Methylophilaceae bacterium]